MFLTLPPDDNEDDDQKLAEEEEIGAILLNISVMEHGREHKRKIKKKRITQRKSNGGIK